MTCRSAIRSGSASSLSSRSTDGLGADVVRLPGSDVLARKLSDPAGTLSAMSHSTPPVALTAAPPYELALSVRAMSGFAPCAGEQQVSAGTVRKA
ncbi:MAG: hypothetical protein QOC83_2673, partial [Pseudonocardiales bacterium]|nr:hypothetical protein [Pseudonocardiales bacterium]